MTIAMCSNHSIPYARWTSQYLYPQNLQPKHQCLHGCGGCRICTGEIMSTGRPTCIFFILFLLSLTFLFIFFLFLLFSYFKFFNSLIFFILFYSLISFPFNLFFYLVSIFFFYYFYFFSSFFGLLKIFTCIFNDT